eukprot:scaffold58118_cov37-Cyclotella_meneghiniana.AAC.9
MECGRVWRGVCVGAYLIARTPPPKPTWRVAPLSSQGLTTLVRDPRRQTWGALYLGIGYCTSLVWTT